MIMVPENETPEINSMEQGPWEADSHSASQEIPRLLWETKVSLPCS